MGIHCIDGQWTRVALRWARSFAKAPASLTRVAGHLKPTVVLHQSRRLASTIGCLLVIRLLARFPLACICLGWLLTTSAVAGDNEEDRLLNIDWQDGFLTINAPRMPGPIQIHYLEAYCRPGSTDRDWLETVIPHESQLVSVEKHQGQVTEIRLRDRLSDGVIVQHVITAGVDEVDFQIIASNPTDTPSTVDWAQPCVRLDNFMGADPDQARQVFPDYIKRCFLFIDGQPVFLPTRPWAKQARYTPGQVYAAPDVDRNDVNPRPLSSLVPSSALCGCISADDKLLLGIAFEPYQEIFQGVITCLHNDFRIGGLQPGQRKTIRGKMYIVPNDIAELTSRFKMDFPTPDGAAN